MATGLVRNQVASYITGYTLSQAIYAIVVLRIPDILADKPRSAKMLARETNCSAPHLLRLMRALCTVGVFTEREGEFYQTELSRCLCRDAPSSLWSMAIFHGSEMYKAASELLQNIRDGSAAWNVHFGKSIWERMEEAPSTSAVFDIAMNLNHEHDLDATIDRYDFTPHKVVADVGGGDGSLLRRIMSRNDVMRGVLLDRQEVVARSEADPRWGRIRERCRFLAGDYFRDIPSGCDLYVFRHVIHDWSDDTCIRLLRHCHAVMEGSGRILLIEQTIGNGRAPVRWADLGIMMIGGQERTLEEYAALLLTAGFRNIRSFHVAADVCLVEGICA